MFENSDSGVAIGIVGKEDLLDGIRDFPGETFTLPGVETVSRPKDILGAIF